MTKEEFREFCHSEFIQRGFKKKKNMYYLKGKDLLAGLYLQKSMAEAYYVEFDFFIGEFNDMILYPTTYEADIHRRIMVLSKDTIKGEKFLDAMIEYKRYSVEEIKPYFDKTFDEYIMPPILDGKKYILGNLDYYLEAIFPKDRQKVLDKLLDETQVGVSAIDKF